MPSHLPQVPPELLERRALLEAFDNLDDFIARSKLITRKYENRAIEVLSPDQYIKIPPRVRQRLEK